MMTYKNKDLHNYIHVGDMITYGSTKAAYTVTDICRSEGAEIPCTAPVIAVYRDYVITQLRIVRDCANRWDIQMVNGNTDWMGGNNYVDSI